MPLCNIKNMKNRKFLSREFTIGAIGIVALLLLYFLINFFKGIDLFKMGERYYVKFDNVSQLVSSSPVYLNGFKAGNVRNITYDFADMKNIIVEIEIDKRLRIPKGSIAKITTHMLGGADISIDMSHENEILAPGDTLKGVLDRGIAGEASDKIMPAFDRIMPRIDSILVSLNTLLANPSLTTSVDNIALLTKELNTTTRQLNTLLTDDVPQITERMVQIEEDMLTVGSQLKEVDYKELFGKIDSTLSNIQQITAEINNGEGTVSALIKNRELYNQLNNTCEAATQLLEDLRKNPKRYVHFSLFGRKEK